MNAVQHQQPVKELHFEGSTSLVSFLEGLGAGRVKHSRRTFLEHLVGTAAILERWGAAGSVCKGGIFHSVYGTERFRHGIVSFDERPRVRALVGEEAERLAYLFCAFDRGSLERALDTGAPYRVTLRDNREEVDLSRAELQGLIWILWANAVEQFAFTPPSLDAVARSRRLLAKSAPFLPPTALQEIDRMYSTVERHGDSGRRSARHPGLQALFDVDDVASFMKDCWPARMHLARGPVERLAGLADYDFDTLVNMSKSHTKAHSRTMDGRRARMFVEEGRGQERALYECGFTIYFHRLNSPEINRWVEAVDAELGLVRGGTRVSAFASRRGLGLRAHYDQNDNFICQARGKKRFRVAPNTHVPFPTIGYTLGEPPNALQAFEAENGFPETFPAEHEVIDLEPGSVLFMPRGMWHEVETIDDESLHFNIQSGLPTWKDALEYILTGTSALHTESLRGPILRLFENGKMRAGVEDELKARLHEAVDAVFESEIDIDIDGFYRYVTGRRGAIPAD